MCISGSRQACSCRHTELLQLKDHPTSAYQDTKGTAGQAAQIAADEAVHLKQRIRLAGHVMRRRAGCSPVLLQGKEGKAGQRPGVCIGLQSPLSLLTLLHGRQHLLWIVRYLTRILCLPTHKPSSSSAQIFLLLMIYQCDPDTGAETSNTSWLSLGLCALSHTFQRPLWLTWANLSTPQGAVQRLSALSGMRTVRPRYCRQGNGAWAGCEAGCRHRFPRPSESC